MLAGLGLTRSPNQSAFISCKEDTVKAAAANLEIAVPTSHPVERATMGTGV